MDNSTCSSSVNNSNAIFSEEKKKKKPGGKVVKLSTDPQSVAARERRHRISDRFKILQSLVPGGSKMDTVSMLDEAIHYVKFLKTQIWLHQTMINFAAEDDHRHPNENLVLHDCDPSYCYACGGDDVLAGDYNIQCSQPNYGVCPGNYTMAAQGGSAAADGGVGLQVGETMPAVDGAFNMYP